MDIGVELMSNVIGVFKKVSNEFLDEGFKLQQVHNDYGDFYATAMRFVTGLNPPEVVWFEVVIVWTDKLDKERYNEILMNIHEWTPFKYCNGYDRFYGRIVYIVPKTVKGVFPPKLLTKRSFIDVRAVRKFERILYVVLNPKMDYNKVIASALAYLVNFFANRAVALESAIFNEKVKRVSIWRKVKMIFHGIANGAQARLSSSPFLRLLYNNIYYRTELLEEQGRISEPLAKTIKLLAELFFMFAKKFDKYASKVYAWVVSTQLYKLIKEKVGFRNVPTFAENVKKIWDMAREFVLRLEARRILSIARLDISRVWNR